jgi:hypothetical protein
MKARLSGLDDFGLTPESFWQLNPKTRVRVEIDVPYPNIQLFAPLAPGERKNRIHASMERAARRILKAWPGSLPEIARSDTGRPHRLSGWLLLSELRKLVRMAATRRVWVNEIGRRKKRRKKQLDWYAVLARFAIQIEGQRAGLQGFEDRTVIVRAWDNDDAIRRLHREFDGYVTPYLNLSYELVRWQFEKVLEVQWLSIDDSPDPKGAEVFSTMRSRRMRREFEWHPLREKTAKRRG